MRTFVVNLLSKMINLLVVCMEYSNTLRKKENRGDIPTKMTTHKKVALLN